MRSSSFKNLKYKELTCLCCGKTFPKEKYSYRYANSDGTAKFCKVCDWINRHNGVPIIDGFTEEQIKTALYFQLFEESEYINDLSAKLNISIDDTVTLVRSLNIGNKKIRVKNKCTCCGKEIEQFLNVYKKTKNPYCSESCYWNDKTNHIPKGKNSPFYNRVKTKCTNCEKEILVIPHNNDLKNSFGDNHNFCCQKCYWSYRSKYYIGEKASMWNKPLSDEQKERMRIASAKRCAEHTQVNSKIQLKINDILDKKNICYTREHHIKYYSMDNYLDDYRLSIEVMGDYWHANPLKYNDIKYKINKKQADGIHRDKIKHSYIKNNNNFEILYLWETDINKHICVCEKLIDMYVANNGDLPNYHSFNWEIDENDELRLREDIITPYQDMKVDEYRHLIENIS